MDPNFRQANPANNSFTCFVSVSIHAFFYGRNNFNGIKFRLKHSSHHFSLISNGHSNVNLVRFLRRCRFMYPTIPFNINFVEGNAGFFIVGGGLYSHDVTQVLGFGGARFKGRYCHFRVNLIEEGRYRLSKLYDVVEHFSIMRVNSRFWIPDRTSNDIHYKYFRQFTLAFTNRYRRDSKRSQFRFSLRRLLIRKTFRVPNRFIRNCFRSMDNSFLSNYFRVPFFSKDMALAASTGHTYVFLSMSPGFIAIRFQLVLRITGVRRGNFRIISLSKEINQRRLSGNVPKATTIRLLMFFQRNYNNLQILVRICGARLVWAYRIVLYVGHCCAPT